ncbi:MAG: tyrosine-type recombinase/integrase [Cellulosilyticaceae bacterium]
MQIDKAINFFITSLKYEQLSSHTIRAYRQDLVQWQEAVGKKELGELGFEDFENYFIYLQELALKVTSLRRKRVVIQRFLKFCYDKKFSVEPLHHFINPIRTKKTVTPKEVLTKVEIERIKEYLEEQVGHAKQYIGTNHYNYLYYCSVRNELMVYILLYTGLRAAELVGIKKKDLDLEGEALTILAKGSKYNTIPLHEELLKALVRYEEKLSVIESDENIMGYGQSLYVFPSKQNHMEHLATRTLYDLMEKLSGVLGRHIHAHLFRHTFASYCIAANMDIATLSALVSHSNPSITLSIYTHEIQGKQKQQEMKKLTFDI